MRIKKLSKMQLRVVVIIIVIIPFVMHAAGVEKKDLLALLISYSALLFSFFAYASNAEQHENDNVDNWRKELTNTIASLVNTTITSTKWSNKDMSESQLVALKGLYKTQQRYLIARAEILMEKIQQNLTDTDYSLIARACELLGHHDNAEGNWKKSIELARNTVDKVNNIRGYACYLFSVKNFDEARKQFFSITSEGTLRYNCSEEQIVEAYIVWAKNELNFDHVEKATLLRGSALQITKNISNQEIREEMLGRIRHELSIDTRC